MDGWMSLLRLHNNDFGDPSFLFSLWHFISENRYSVNDTRFCIFFTGSVDNVFKQAEWSPDFHFYNKCAGLWSVMHWARNSRNSHFSNNITHFLLRWKTNSQLMMLWHTVEREYFTPSVANLAILLPDITTFQTPTGAIYLFFFCLFVNLFTHSTQDWQQIEPCLRQRSPFEPCKTKISPSLLKNLSAHLHSVVLVVH